MTPWQRYQADLARPEFMHDAAQEHAVRQLQRLYDDFCARETQPASGLKGLWNRVRKAPRAKVQGIYFWGGVGRGKTYLVDTFFECLPTERKLRAHFHRFMHRVHQELKVFKGETDPLLKIADKIAGEADIICFDEFFVSDITDAMLLGTLFEALFERGIILVATSNIVPDELYRNGLQRARFLPAIALIKANCDVVNVDSGIDYRLRTLEQAKLFHYPCDQQGRDQLQSYLGQLATEPARQDVTLEVEGRPIAALAEADGVLLIDFAALCDGPRSQADYMELARLYHSVLVSDVFQMGANKEDVARRFIAMVDEFYERGVKLIMLAEVDMFSLYAGERLQFEFQRCLSRLQEMQSKEYLARPHKP
ncbi:cell division protein ZapE [Gallaecimonas xiamenensis]|uniref:Cell division protein ZapE n=1 Tax=Gallaecimonas xiamenensis 3-C-1 TaxID=745411 RepID=K2J8D7_9GAMM|nr:cell division protein ZapE [Gallaecimonas xiamenensis]EKE71473.1 AFG1 family ATPase [Gallaecimonas xiamenensis 3-C-1]